MSDSDASTASSDGSPKPKRARRSDTPIPEAASPSVDYPSGDCPSGDCPSEDYPSEDYPSEDCPGRNCPSPSPNESSGDEMPVSQFPQVEPIYSMDGLSDNSSDDEGNPLYLHLARAGIDLANYRQHMSGQFDPSNYSSSSYEAGIADRRAPENFNYGIGIENTFSSDRGVFDPFPITVHLPVSDATVSSSGELLNDENELLNLPPPEAMSTDASPRDTPMNSSSESTITPSPLTARSVQPSPREDFYQQ